jgi:uncharacterized protein (TIGR03437 family)
MVAFWAGILLAQSPAPVSPSPNYAPSTIVNAANPHAGSLAPNTIASIYGKDLAYITKGISGDDVRNGVLPVAIPNTGVKVLINRIAAPLYFVSPGQVNFLVPSNLTPGPAEILLGLDSRFGPAVRVELAEASPALFQLDPEVVVATYPDASVVTREKPARPGDVIILYATGLGLTVPRMAPGQIAATAARLERRAEFRVLLGNVDVPRESILYSGIAPGFAGLYQINLKLPDTLGADPEIRIGFGDKLSPAGLRLLAQP